MFELLIQMIIEHTLLKVQMRTHNIQTHKERKQGKGFEGKKIINQIAYNSASQKSGKSKIQTPAHFDQPQTDTFRQLLSRRDRQKQSQTKIQHRLPKKHNDDKSDKNIIPQNKSFSKSKSKSRQKSKGLAKSKSLKQLGKKSKSMVRFDMKEKKQNNFYKEQKRQSPSRQYKTNTILQKKNYKSSYVSKTTNRQYTSQITTDRDKSKGKMKISQISKQTKKVKKIQQPKKKSPKPIDKKKTIQKQNKGDKKIKSNSNYNKIKKDKKVIISQQQSKCNKKHDYQQWQSSINDQQFLHPKQKKDLKQKKGKNKDSNIVDIPKRKQRLSLNPTMKRNQHQKNTKTQAQIQQQKQKLKDLQHQAAITIQKVFRGYLTRKYIRQCFQHNAAINIQRVWRGYQVRKLLYESQKQKSVISLQQIEIQPNQKQKRRQVLTNQQYLIQKSSSRQQSMINSHISYNEKWASILQQILSQQSVHENIKKKIQQFLQKQKKQMNQFDYRSNQSSKSSISNQIINNQINSQKNFIQNFNQHKKQMKKYSNINVFISPTNYKSPKKFPYNSPQSYINSPNYFLHQKIDESRELNSSEMLIQNLKNIQKLHKQRLQNQANSQKNQLNNMLIKNTLSPRTHQKKYKQVDQQLNNQLSKFNQSINQIVTCILFKQQSHQHQNKIYKKNFQNFGQYQQDMITPKKQLVQFNLPYQMPEQCIQSQKLSNNDSATLLNFKKMQQKSQEFCDYYKYPKEQLKKQSSLSAFNTSYQFIEQYLINLIDYVRAYDSGSYVHRILDFLKKPRNRQAEIILNNLKAVTQSSQEDLDNSFKLPMYKYEDCDETIIDSQVVQAFNVSFRKMKNNEFDQQNQLEKCFIKMIADCMNQALNALRPTYYIFTQTQIKTMNMIKSMQKMPAFQSDNNSQQQMQYQFMLAQSLNSIFYWNKLQWGKIVNMKNDGDIDNYQQLKGLLMRQQDQSILLLTANQQWIYWEQMIEIIGRLTQQMFCVLIYQEIAIIWTTQFQHSRKIKQNSSISLHLSDNKKYFNQ